MNNRKLLALAGNERTFGNYVHGMCENTTTMKRICRLLGLVQTSLGHQNIFYFIQQLQLICPRMIRWLVGDNSRSSVGSLYLKDGMLVGDSRRSSGLGLWI